MCDIFFLFSLSVFVFCFLGGRRGTRNEERRRGEEEEEVGARGWEEEEEVPMCSTVSSDAKMISALKWKTTVL